MAARDRRYYRRHREQRLKEASEWRKDHPERNREYQRKWRERHRPNRFITCVLPILVALLAGCGRAPTMAKPQKSDAHGSKPGPVRPKATKAADPQPAPSPVPKAVEPAEGAPAADDAIVVSAKGDGDYTTIAQAVRECDAGATIVVRSGPYDEEVTIRKSLTIASYAKERPVVWSNSDAACVTIQAGDVTITGMTIACSSAATEPPEYAAVLVTGGSAVFKDCDIAMKSAQADAVVIRGERAEAHLKECRVRGGHRGVRVTSGARGVIDDCDVSGASKLGVVVSDDGTGSLLRTKIHDVGRIGLMSSKRGRVRAVECEFYDNDVLGIMCTTSGTLAAENCIVHGCRTGVEASYKAELSMEKCRVYKNRGNGVISVRKGSATLDRCEISENGGSGAVMTYWGKMTARDCTFRDNGRFGCQIWTTGALFENCDFYHNKSEEACVEVVWGKGSAVRRCRIYANRSDGLHAHAPIEVEECEIYDNAGCGVLFTYDEKKKGKMTLDRCTVRNNAKQGILFKHKTGGDVTRCLVKANAGTGIEFHNGTWATVRSCVVRDGAGDGIRARAGAKGSVIACSSSNNKGEDVKLDPEAHMKVEDGTPDLGEQFPRAGPRKEQTPEREQVF